MNWYSRIIIKTADWADFSYGTWKEVTRQLEKKLGRRPHPSEVQKELIERFMNFGTPENKKWQNTELLTPSMA